MQEFHLVWEIDIEAESPAEAALQALKIQRDKNSSATVFDVIDEKGESHRVDLSAREEN